MKIAVIGSTGVIGSEVAALLKQKGHDVTAVSRSTSPAVDISNPKTIEAFYAAGGKYDAVICTAGNATFGSITELSDEEYMLSVKSKLMGQVNLVRKGIKNLNPGGVFILTGGTLAYKPWPNSSSISMVNAALDGFVKGAALDMVNDKRVVVVHPPLVKETAIQIGMEPDMWPKASVVAKAYLKALTGKKNGAVYFVKGYEA